MSVQDTFYDPEDGSTRSLKLSLLTMDRTQVPLTNWLQFDVKNQEFFGTPMLGDEGRREYQLVRQLQMLFSSSLIELLRAPYTLS
jgi:neurexin